MSSGTMLELLSSEEYRNVIVAALHTGTKAAIRTALGIVLTFSMLLRGHSFRHILLARLHLEEYPGEGFTKCMALIVSHVDGKCLEVI